MKSREQDGSRRRPTSLTALQYAVKLLSSRSYSEAKLREKLLARGYEAGDIDYGLERLREKRLLDDRRYAEEFVRTRLTMRPRAASILIRELRQRGIAQRLAKQVTDELVPREANEDIARDLIRRKLAVYAKLDPMTRRRRLAALLARRGFPYDTIDKVLRNESDSLTDE
ncbi:MAG: regulatory protein RecX [Calditrichota bacterium]